jgi:teichuronic acid biosynthesis glycosyltransferase TuaC
MQKDDTMRVLMITSEWPTPENPHWVPFIVRQVEFLRNAGVDLDLFAFRGAQNPLNYVRAWFKVRRKLRHGSYDLVHAQWSQSAPLALPTRLPLVVTFRGGEVEGIVGRRSGRFTFMGEVLRAVSTFMAKRADELVLVSSHMRQFLPQRPSHILPSGLDFSKLPIIPRAEARRQLGLPAEKRLVLFVGNPDDALKRFSLAKEIVSLVDKGLDVQLVHAWRVLHHLIPVYMNACDALLFTSIYEGSPNAIKEALACNLPIVSVAVGDVAERIKGVDGCIVCPEADPRQMARALESVLRDPARTNGRNAVRELDENILAKRMIEIYRQAMAKKTMPNRKIQIGTRSEITAAGDPSQK